MRAVVDVNVLISGVLSTKGSSAEILRASRDGQFELVVSELLLAELKRTLAYPSFASGSPRRKPPPSPTGSAIMEHSPRIQQAHRQSAPETLTTTISSRSRSNAART